MPRFQVPAALWRWATTHCCMMIHVKDLQAQVVGKFSKIAAIMIRADATTCPDFNPLQSCGVPDLKSLHKSLQARESFMSLCLMQGILTHLQLQ